MQGIEQWAKVPWYVYLLYDAAGMGIALVVSGAFYRSLWPGVLALAGIPLYHKLVRRQWREQKRRQFRREFRDALQQMQGYLQAGRSLENAMYETERYLREHEPEGILSVQWRAMVNRLQHNGTAETVWTEFARRNPLEEVRQFAGILSAARRSGGDMTEMIQSAVGKISLLIQTEEEIEGMVASSRLQMYVLEVVPVALLWYMNLAAPEIGASMYESALGMVIMTGCLGIYLGAVWLGNRITDIRV